MPQMRAAAAAAHLRAHHAMAAILAQLDAVLIDRVPERRPAAAGLELRLRREQRLVAGHTAVQPLFVMIVVDAGKGHLRPRHAGNTELLWRQALAPVLLW